MWQIIIGHVGTIFFKAQNYLPQLTLTPFSCESPICENPNVRLSPTIIGDQN